MSYVNILLAFFVRRKISSLFFRLGKIDRISHSSVAKITFGVAEMTFKFVMITSSVAKITFVVAEITLKMAVITSSVVKITFEKWLQRM